MSEKHLNKKYSYNTLYCLVDIMNVLPLNKNEIIISINKRAINLGELGVYLMFITFWVFLRCVIITE